ncbi:MAG: hypothetical protein ACFFCP_03280 [Promethearchaeota archaeon]
MNPIYITYLTLLRAVTYVLLVACYLLFPIWMLLDSIVLQIAFAFVIALVVPEILGYLFEDILGEKSRKIDITSIVKRNKTTLCYFVGTSFVYTLILLPLILAPIKPLNDESAHISRIVFLERILTLGSRLDSTLIGIGYTLGVIIVGVVILIGSGMLGENRVQSVFQALFGKTILSRIFRVIVGAGFCVLIVLASSDSIDSWNIARFGPLQPVSYVGPLLLFGYTDTTLLILRQFNLLLMVLSAVFIMKITSDLLDAFSSQKGNEYKIQNILGMVAGWTFLFYTPTIILSSQLMLTAGLTMFFTLNCFLFIRFFKSLENKPNRIYLLSLFVSLGIGSLWKRVLLVQAISFILILLLWSLSRPNYVESLKLWFKLCIIYSILFGPWLVVAQFGGLVTRDYIPSFNNILPPVLYDYLLRFNLQMGIFWGMLGYTSIFLMLLLAVWKRSWILLTIAPTYTIWYIFFTLDTAWSHVEDRFFVPALSLLAASTAFLIGVFVQESLKIFVDSRREGSVLSTQRTRKISVLVVTLFLLFPFSVGIGERSISISQQINYSANNEYLAYDQAASYVHSIINGDSSRLYSRFGQSGFNYYMREYGNYFYSLSGFGEVWVPEEGNESAGQFIEYLRSNNYTVLAMPDAKFCHRMLVNATAIIGELVERYSSFGITEYRAFQYGETSFHVWVL